MVVIYCEKLSQAKAIATALNAGNKQSLAKDKRIGYWNFDFNGEEAYLVHGFGHLVRLKYPTEYDVKYKKWNLTDYPFFKEEYQLVPIETAKTCYDFIKEMFGKADWIISATDADREGELIFYYLYTQLKCKKPWKRVWVSSDLTEKNLFKDFNSLIPSRDRIPLIEAGINRSLDDFLYGINLTVAMSRVFSTGKEMGVLPIGRVQTPTLNLIVQREKDIKAHKKSFYYNVEARFENNIDRTKTFKASYEKDKLTKKDADNIVSKCRAQMGEITEVNVKKVKNKVPLLYNTTKLQTTCNKQFGWSAKKTSSVLQSLYENKFVTYPRTESEYLSDENKADVVDALNKLFNTKEYSKYKPTKSWAPFSKRHFNNTKANSQSHTAIIPTTNIPDISKLSYDEKKLYDTIAKSIIAIVYEDAVVEQTDVVVVVKNGSEQFKFKATGKVLTNPKNCWYVVLGQKAMTSLPDIKKGELYNGLFNSIKKETSPPKRYTEGELLKAMETAGKLIEDEEAATIIREEHKGLGTPATRAAIIETLKSRNLIDNSGKSLYPTEKGIYLIENLPVDELKSVEMTGMLEKQLYQMAQYKNPDDALSVSKQHKKETIIKVMDYFRRIANSKPISSYKGVHKKMQATCPMCGNPLKSFEWGICCENHKPENSECDFVLSRTILSKKLSDEQLDTLLTKGKTEIIKDFVSKKTNKSFDACLVYNKEENKISFSFDDVGETTTLKEPCPICGKTVKSFGWGVCCEDHKKDGGCKFALGRKLLGKTISDANFNTMLSKGETKIINGFKSKKGNTFNAKLKYNEADNKFDFEFAN